MFPNMLYYFLYYNATVYAMKINLYNFVYILYVLTKNYVDIVYVNKSSVCLSVLNDCNYIFIL